MTADFTVLWSFENYLAANRLIAKRHRLRNWLIALSAVVVGVSISGPLQSDFSVWEVLLVTASPIFIGLSACVVGFWLVDKIVLPRQARHRYDQQKIDGTTTTYHFDSVGMLAASPIGNSTLEWDHFTGWAEDDHVLMLFRTSLMFHAAPKSQVAHQTLENLRALIIAANVRKH